MKSKVIGLLVIISFVMVMLLTGCSSDGDSKGSKKTVTVLINSGFKEDYFKAVKTNFEKKHSDIEISLITVPYDQVDSKLSALVAGGTPPDIWSHWADSGFSDYVHRGLVADLTPYMEEFDNPNIPDKLMEIYNLDGKQYGIPFSIYSQFLYYNKKLFDEAGVPYPDQYKWGDPEWNWDEVVSLAKKLTKNYGKPDAVYGLTSNIGDSIDSYAWDWDADIYTDEEYKSGFVTESRMDNPKFVEAIEFFQSLVFEEEVSPTSAITDAMAKTGDPFVTGRVAMNIVGGWGLGNYKKSGVDFGIAPIPTGPNGKATAHLYVDPIMMSSKSKNPDAAWKLVEYLTSEEGQMIWAEQGYPPADSVAIEKWYSQFDDNIAPGYLKELVNAGIEGGKESPNHLLVGYSDILTFMTNESQPIFLKNEEPSKVLAEMDKKFEDVIEKIKQRSQK